VDEVLSLLVQAHGETLGRLIWGAYQTAATAAEAQRRLHEAQQPAPDEPPSSEEGA
jgi:hypothetical protein